MDRLYSASYLHWAECKMEVLTESGQTVESELLTESGETVQGVVMTGSAKPYSVWY